MTSSPPLDFSSFADLYERWLVGPLFRPWAELLLDRTGLRPGERLLDVACGTGIVARLAHRRVGAAGRVVGVDRNAQMLAVARAVAPDLDWREGDAGALPLVPGEQFDVVTCHQGLQFFPDRPGAAGELRRGLAPGGRLGLAVWRPVEESPLVHELQRVAERHVGAVTDQRHAFGDPAALEALLIDAGFGDVRVIPVTRAIRFPDGAVFVRMNAMALIGMSAAGKSMGEQERAATAALIVEDSAEVLARYSGPDGLVFEISANVATAGA